MKFGPPLRPIWPNLALFCQLFRLFSQIFGMVFTACQPPLAACPGTPQMGWNLLESTRNGKRRWIDRGLGPAQPLGWCLEASGSPWRRSAMGHFGMVGGQKIQKKFFAPNQFKMVPNASKHFLITIFPCFSSFFACFERAVAATASVWVLIGFLGPHRCHWASSATWQADGPQKWPRLASNGQKCGNMGLEMVF